MKHCNHVFLYGIDHLAAIILVKFDYTIPERFNHLLISHKNSLETEMVGKFGVFEFLKYECNVED